MSEPAPAPGAPPPLPAPRPSNPWTGLALDVVLAVAGILIVSTLLIAPLVAIEAFRQSAAGQAIADGDALVQAALPQITVAAIVTTLVVGLLAWWLRGRRLAPPAPRLSLAGASALAVLAGVLVQGIALAAMQGLQAVAGEGPATPSNAAPILALQQASPVLTWLMVVVVAPLGEELLFRRVMLHRFMVAGRALAGLVVTSLLFAATHELGQGDGHSLLHWLGLIAVYTGMGMGFGAVYLRTGRLSSAVLAHAACNATAMAAMAFSGA
ncbi:CPBP family intramembrane glutamic endopeptidase [Arenimonas caeni]|jgi:membrane protease YdiL (CAAX protease family)|uniref:CAAX prenyl protease 2/Lysostaphin resistance protein A-like domain-containing protein n=1 Tax=Arenimonas caeni TaxID=2058085 RepID=A0A2P6M7I1_9GAMM|nr:CPBP family intramembrane glutamic endopeptidase [Arenimonas caeni]MDY0022718.1 CPBP family intramembrane glutamic endopeptidase [Arenimonas caeni]PRH81949.1 hypothetical protein C6N40_10180 [Arenimonas caeni]